MNLLIKRENDILLFMRIPIVLNGKNFFYTLKKSRRAKRLRVTISHQGDLCATLPWKCDEKIAEDFMKKKALWIVKTVETVKNNSLPLNSLRPIENLKNCKPEVENFLTERIKFYNKFYSFTYNHIRVKKLRRNWGSCTVKKIINFNYLLFFLPLELADYVVVHELCHLKEMNHSVRFWKLVAHTIPDHKERRKKLRRVTYEL